MSHIHSTPAFHSWTRLTVLTPDLTWQVDAETFQGVCLAGWNLRYGLNKRTTAWQLIPSRMPQSTAVLFS
eukprot:scaffold287078_cov26-Prasinocladus_malaysianus.AAC.1